MNESFSSPEQKSEITRGEVISAYRRFVEQGITNPDDLDLNNPEVQEANELFDQWQKQEDARAKGNEESMYRVNLAKTMLFVDAGFTDPDYLDEILRDQLNQDAQDVEKQSDNPERVETRRRIAEAMKKVRNLLKKP